MQSKLLGTCRLQSIELLNRENFCSSNIYEKKKSPLNQDIFFLFNRIVEKYNLMKRDDKFSSPEHVKLDRFLKKDLDLQSSS